jgi:hypothetical protein
MGPRRLDGDEARLLAFPAPLQPAEHLLEPPAQVTGPGQAAGEDITIVIGINDDMR